MTTLIAPQGPSCGVPPDVEYVESRMPKTQLYRHQASYDAFVNS